MSQPIWIWPERSGSVNAYARFEATFHFSGGALFAGIAVTGEYALFINDSLAGFGQYPDWPACRTENIHEITRLAHPAKTASSCAYGTRASTARRPSPASRARAIAYGRGRSRCSQAI